jgi:hypothetical protein
MQTKKKKWAFNTFVPAFLTQKLAEILLFSFLSAAQLYIFNTVLRNYPSEQTGNAAGITVFVALETGIGAATIIFLCSFYPFVSLLFLLAYRKFVSPRDRNHLPLVSAGFSAAYLIFWLSLIGLKLQVSSWVVAAIMIVFVYVSSVWLYPPLPSRAARGSGGLP